MTRRPLERAGATPFTTDAEELGLHEVAQITPEQRQDPGFFRGADFDGLGRDGCRVPLPWTADGSSFGFGAGDAHLPQPDWCAEYAVDVEAADPSSTLSLYREALGLRHLLQTGETLEWIDTGRADVLRFVRPNGWQVVSNFGTTPFHLGADAADVVLASAPLEGSALPGAATALPGEATVWIAR